ncbi:hypothetical protein Z043_108625 [Scleropages formosus]|uniref:Uncharacterized protein n=1 Tax=Scleropages formosus TaxID=113540 RepID=A0A0P7UDV9_SCLFO|nr:hypothetical protein Z043_108625 [Scleropages formosus]
MTKGSPALSSARYVLREGKEVTLNAELPGTCLKCQTCAAAAGVSHGYFPAWLHSLQGSEPNLSPEQESETGSVGSGCSLPDQGYAPSEGTAEDSPFVSSPSDLTHPASPDGSVSPDGGPAPPRARSRALAKDSSSDSDEGCATWGSRHRCRLTAGSAVLRIEQSV